MRKKIKTFSVCAVIVESKFIGHFQAESEEQAIKMAREEADISLCHHCSAECENAEIEELIAEEVKP